ncbi:hypothetical protein EMIHUDRAFT_239085 [Emiliania huxleyi CCMP1516]|uniref:FCP1 homology domain-containing protein n=2 Tax=Emiliania huxleyi TaxID=2903 RepID=A0A0D3JJZ8_EMIH1|nr:hypothetical protein EMIHUDRAFT_239085 [Emiliania huxleyi CCMP1516]EOD23833.1 hypothetical protein EMIHUDRAFT_239085 [Emiliania huxleyi CCMP1516]|eukprot:XP_005776262.1 hypothetical protein EMIHUDRAFT_239085 [Emiliania huxleyi CCMP1516]
MAIAAAAWASSKTDSRSIEMADDSRLGRSSRSTSGPRAEMQASDDALRAAFASVPGPHPLDADSVNLALFAVGWDHLLRDLRLGLPTHTAHAVVGKLVADGVRSAFALRNNLVHFKKIILGIHQTNILLVHDCRRLSTFFRRGYIRSSRYRALSDALCETEGALGALLDARRFTKAPCSHSRCAGVLALALPGSMKGYRLLQEAVTEAVQAEQLGRELEAHLGACTARMAALQAAQRGDSGFAALVDTLSSELRLSPASAWFVRCALIARGGAKALVVAEEARKLTAAMCCLLEACTKCAATLADGHERRLHGLSRCLESLVHWLAVISEGNAEGRVLFVGTDGDLALGTTSFVPRGFDGLLKPFEAVRALADGYSTQMVDRIAAEGWPSGRGGRRGASECSHCALSLPPTWVRDGVCLGCEHRVRREGRCPYGGIGRRSKCDGRAWCAHDQRCFICDGWSCGACRLLQGDGADVAAAVEALQPLRLFVDFDRTLCSTRGGSPLHGSHTVDDDLVSLISQLEGRVHIVTRNVHVDGIRSFLDGIGLTHVPVHRVPKPRSKAEVVCDPRWAGGAEGHGGGDGVVLFVDDSISEHLREDIRSNERVVRFLFSRTRSSAAST